MTRTFFHGSRRKTNSHLEGTVLSAALAGILAVSIIMNAWYSFARANYGIAKKTLTEYYEKLDAHNAAAGPIGQNDTLNNGGFK